MIIYLIGMPGAGKSELGKKLSQVLNYQFIDMDEYIEKKACMFIDEIFNFYGEEYFRALETNTLKELSNLDNVVISTGALSVIPMCIIAKVFRRKIIFIESFAKVTSPTMTGKFIYKFADQFYIQWEELRSVYKNAIYKGGIY